MKKKMFFFKKSLVFYLNTIRALSFCVILIINKWKFLINVRRSLRKKSYTIQKTKKYCR